MRCEILSKNEEVFTKENLDLYLKEVAKEFRKRNGKHMPAEMILVGGAAVLANYGFRDMTTDIDAVIHASSAMKDAINKVGDKFHLPNGWLNSDFMRTESYSSKIFEVSIYYKTFSNILSVRLVSAEYLIAMKLRSGRKYKNDLSDIIGILAEHEKMGYPITLEAVKDAVIMLYNGWENIPVDSRLFIEDAFEKGNFGEVYKKVRESEQKSKQLLIDFQENYPDAVVSANINEILNQLKKNN